MYEITIQWRAREIILYENYLDLQEVTEDKATKVHFIKCHCPFDVLKFYAEEMSFRAPLEVEFSLNE